ncbi:valine--tRNA ligase-like [Paramacrobiotus metropolitanus]|uniref:valine--tRNA ligase-like n=1 Tax=Paramacrobiotus metropolitanus TaxID=2943436 RepID=UPI00244654A4|nr:valine--tRNA ligase-like [Paramacrobiotus metropolitanus]
MFLRFLASRNYSSKPALTALPKKYDAKFVESRWYDWWLANGYFTPESTTNVTTSTEKPFSIIIPPPNVTGSLHLGHALTIAIEDALVRWHRMRGQRVLWVPGLDHSGIATQVQVEKKLWNDRKMTRQQVGREEFLKLADAWKEEKSAAIKKQIRRMGAVVDWRRLVFTLDESVQYGVREAFIRLFEKGKIYRQEKMINWCSYLNSTISDIEINHLDVPQPTSIAVPGERQRVDVGWLNCFAYPLADSATGEEIVVGTTRLETMLGDVAVAVHPADMRYLRYRGCEVIHPLTGERLPIIRDEAVDPTIGTGALKVTPAHDPKDFEFTKRHFLMFLRVIDDQGRIISPMPELNGLSRFEARRKIEQMLIERSLWRGQHPFPTTLPLCSRSGDIIEPQLKKQWFLNCKEYATKAAEAVNIKSLKLIPDRFDKIWHQWLAGEQDWCLSRQLWWGQQIPAYKVVIKGQEHWTAAHTPSEAAKKLALKLKVSVDTIKPEQDPDVLDTWFTSSALPFLTFGWPSKTSDLEKFYPLSMMETGHDILFFWVARMVFMGIALTEQIPFDTVLLHGLVCDKHGKKMSKSTGNVIDPMTIVCDFDTPDAKDRINIGSDALKFALCREETQQHVLNVDVERIEECNKYCNKIWQAFRFCSEVWEKYPVVDAARHSPDSDLNQWILNSLHELIAVCGKAMENYTLDVAANSLYSFWFDKFCDVYLECVKSVVKSEDDPVAAQRVSRILFTVFDVYLRLISLFMPNLAEELYQRLPVQQFESVCVAAFPSPEEISVSNMEIQDAMGLVNDIARTVRNVRHLYNLRKERVPIIVLCDDSIQSQLEPFQSTLATISQSSDVSFVRSEVEAPKGCAVQILENGVKVFVHLDQFIDIEKEIQRYENQKRKLEGSLAEEEEVKEKRYNRLPEKKRTELDGRINNLKTKIDEIVQIQEKVRALK